LRAGHLLAVGLVTATAGLALAAIMGELPRWRPGGTRMIAHPPLVADGARAIKVPRGGIVLIRGDSNATRRRIGDASAWPDWLARSLGPGNRVVNQSIGGITAREGLARWRVPEGTRLCIIAYGTNDGAARGWLSNKRAEGTAPFIRTLTETISRCRAAGAGVLVLAPLPAGSDAIEHRISPYRDAARTAARNAGADFADPMEAFDVRALDAPLLNYDALHMNAVAHRLMGIWIASRIRAD
jgi:lysophospholipase L1-like esterase